MWEISCKLIKARHRSWNCETQDKVVNANYCISSNNSRGQFFFHTIGGQLFEGRQLFQNYIVHWKSALNILKRKKNFASNKLNMGFSCVPNMVPWLIFNVNTLFVRAWITTDQFCWIREREDGGRGRGGGGQLPVFEGGDNLNIPSKGRQLIEGRLLFEEIW